MQLIVGLVLLVGSIFAYWYSLPQDGQVRSFLRSDQVQAYYAVTLIGGFAGGLLLTVLGLVSLFR